MLVLLFNLIHKFYFYEEDVIEHPQLKGISSIFPGRVSPNHKSDSVWSRKFNVPWSDLDLFNYRAEKWIIVVNKN